MIGIGGESVGLWWSPGSPKVSGPQCAQHLGPLLVRTGTDGTV